jgi:hypothetical protein
MTRFDRGNAKLFARLVLAAGIGILGANNAPAAEPLPNEPIKTILYLFGKATADEARTLATGEFGEMVAKGGTPVNPALVFNQIKIVSQDEKRAVVSADLPGQHPLTGYVFLERQGGQWKVEALRTLTVPPQLVNLRLAWPNMTDEQRKQQFRNKPPEAQADFERLLVAVDLAMKPDRDEMAFFNEHKPVFAGLLRDMMAGGLSGAASVASLRANQNEGWATAPEATRRTTMASDLETLLIAAGVRASFGPKGKIEPLCGEDCATFTVLSAGSNNVGYLWIGPKGKVPEMAPQGFIVIEPLGEGWYLFKTA